MLFENCPTRFSDGQNKLQLLINGITLKYIEDGMQNKRLETGSICIYELMYGKSFLAMKTKYKSVNFCLVTLWLKNFD